MSMGDGRAKNVLEYLDNLIEKGKATSGAIKPLKIAFTKVVQTIDGEEWESTEVKSIDVEDYMARFANLTMGKYSSNSLTEYKSRVNKVIGWYIQFLDKPGWTPDIQKRNRTPKASSPTKAEQISVISPRSDDLRDVPQTMPSVVNAPGRILYPYPLLDGQLIHISLPIKLSKQDARRIGAFIESIAVEPTEEVN
jgi:hypothetical protein